MAEYDLDGWTVPDLINPDDINIIMKNRPQMTPAQLTLDSFAMRLAASPAASLYLTAQDQDQMHGMTANAFVSVSLDPPLVLVSLDNRSNMHRILPTVRRFGISVLAEDQKPLSNHFAGRKVPGLHVRLVYRNGIPLIGGRGGILRGEVLDIHPAGDHTLYIAAWSTSKPARGIRCCFTRDDMDGFAKKRAGPPSGRRTSSRCFRSAAWIRRLVNWRFHRVLVEAVSEAANRADQRRIGGVRLDLLAQPQDIHIHGAIGNRAVVPPDRIQKLLATVNYARAAHKKLKQPELGGGERDFSPSQRNAATCPIQLQFPRPHRAGRRRLRTELVLHPRDQLANEERLHHVVVGAEFQAQDAVGFGSSSGKENDRHVRQLGMISQAFANLQAIGIRQHDIENRQVGPFASAKLNCAASGL